MPCGGCGGNVSRVVKTDNKPVAEAPKKSVLPLAEKTEEGKAMVKLRYYGGGYSTKGGGCKSCGGTGTSYTFVTTETIQFVSEDEVDGMFKRKFTVGHDYLVTEKQAEYLLTLTFRSKAGRTTYKFKKVEE